MGPSGAESAYENVKGRIAQVDDDKVKSGESLTLNLLHEKAHELSRFATREEQTAKEALLEGNFDEPIESNERAIRQRINQLMNKAKGNLPDEFHTNEAVSRGRKVRRVPVRVLREPQVI
jgi:hypothetical protein